MDKLKEIATQFAINGTVSEIKALGAGFINDTFKVITEGNAPDYILQRKNKNIFPDVPAMMDNICAVTAHLRLKAAEAGDDPDRSVLTVVRTPDGLPYYIDDEGQYWAMCVYIDGSVTYDRADTPALAYMGGAGIGRFQSQLADFPGVLSETIKGFHNIRCRFEQWDRALARDAAGRCASLSEEIGLIESRRRQMLEFHALIESGEIPCRVTHNDTKISNILFDTNGNVLCVIDLDTEQQFALRLRRRHTLLRQYRRRGRPRPQPRRSVDRNVQSLYRRLSVATARYSHVIRNSAHGVLGAVYYL